MAKDDESGYSGLSRQAVLILSLATFAWGTFVGTEIIEALLKAVIVYLAASILVLIIRRILQKMTEISFNKPQIDEPADSAVDSDLETTTENGNTKEDRGAVG